MRISDWSSDVCSSDLLASGGRKVIGVDIDAKTVATINRGEIHIVEPFLDALVSRVVADGFPKATSTPEPADAFLIAVRSAERRVGKECVSTCRSRLSPYR